MSPSEKAIPPKAYKIIETPQSRDLTYAKVDSECYPVISYDMIGHVLGDVLS